MTWRDNARCVGLEPSIFFADDGDVSKAKKVCFSCKVRPECLSYALKNNVEFGVWGGTSGPERRALRRTRSRKLAPAKKSIVLT